MAKTLQQILLDGRKEKRTLQKLYRPATPPTELMGKGRLERKPTEQEHRLRRP